MRNVVQQSFVVFTIGEKSYTVVYQKYMKENVVSSEISVQNKAEMSFQMKRHRTYFRTRTPWGKEPHAANHSQIVGVMCLSQVRLTKSNYSNMAAKQSDLSKFP